MLPATFFYLPGFRRLHEAVNKGQETIMAALEELYTPDYVYHGPGVFGDMDLAAMKQMIPAFYAAFPDQYTTLEDLIAEGDKVVSRYTFRGTHQGEFMGMPPTGKVVTYTGIAICRFAGSKVVEYRSSVDLLGLLQQLGVIPQMAQTGA